MIGVQMLGSRAAVGSWLDKAVCGKPARQAAGRVAVLAAVVLMSGCSVFRGLNQAPVEDRGTSTSRSAPVAVEAAAPVARSAPGSENAGKPDYYTVKPGDTMIRIGLDSGQNWRDIARWSGVENPNQIADCATAAGRGHCCRGPAYCHASGCRGTACDICQRHASAGAAGHVCRSQACGGSSNPACAPCIRAGGSGCARSPGCVSADSHG